MEVEKRRSKGGFLQFFDWNSKSRKKLFSNGPDTPGPDGVKQETDDAEILAKSRLRMNVIDENGVSSTKSRSSECNCAASETSSEGCENRAPGVVARLMGLDSLPKSNGLEPSTLCSEFHQVKASTYSDGTHDLQSRCDPIDYLSSSSRLGRFSSHPAEAKLLKAQNRPIERFQSEMLPPKSAKPISITHHRLLSPVKGPGFIPAKNAAYVMEAAAKIIEASPQVVRSKASSTVSASVPLRIHDLKVKLESAHEASRQQKASNSGSVKNVKGKFNEKSYRIPQDTQPSRTAVVSGKVSSGNWRLKGKSTSLAEQAKVNVNVPTRGAKNQLNKKNLVVEKEQSGENSSQISNGLPRLQKSSQRKTSTSRTNIVLKQNNQKQNSLSDRQDSVSRASHSKQPSGRTQLANGSIGPSKTASKIAVKAETGSTTKSATNISKELKSSRFKTPAHKMNSANSDVNSNRSVTTNVLINGDGMSVKRNTVIDGCVNRGVDGNKNSMDVISFTFSSPIKRCSQEPRADTRMRKNGNFDHSFSGNNGPLDCKDSSSSSPVGSVSDGNFLSVLLEQKLRELTDRIDLSNCEISGEKSLSMPKISNQESVGTLNSVSSVITESEESFQQGLDEVVSSPVVSASTSSDGPTINSKQECQGADSEETEECSSSATSYAAGKETDYEHPSPVSTLESSFMSENCTDSVITYSGNKDYSSSQSPEVLDWLSRREFPTMECEDELSCSTSSSMTADAGTKWATRKESHSLYAGGSRSWELKYVEEMVGNVKLRLEDFGDSEPKLICNGLFNKLENRVDRMDRYDEHSRLRRKLLFDCASECLESRCQDIVNGTCEAWAKWQALFRRKRWLAEDIYREISGRKTIGDTRVDELVNRDMSTRLGKWVEFNVEVFEEGVEIGNRILTTLIDELVAEF